MFTNQGAISDSVIIEQVYPVIDNGLFPVKAVPGETIAVSADIFSHGNYAIASRLLHKLTQDNVWQETFMKPTENDRWAGQFDVPDTGHYLFKIVAWIDQAASWQQKVALRLNKYQPISDCLSEGISILEKMHKSAEKEDKALIKEALRIFRDENREDAAAQLAISFRFTEWANRYSSSNKPTETIEFPVLVLRAKTVFSSWYTMYPRSSGPEQSGSGTFLDVVDLLPRIAALGFDVLHFPPIHPVGDKARRGRNGLKIATKNDPGSVYAIGNKQGGHLAIDSQLGSVADLKALIEEAKKLGIEIALDLSLTFSPDHPWVFEHPDWFESKFSELTGAESLDQASDDELPLQLNAENQNAVSSAVLEIIDAWISWGIHIIRVERPDEQGLNWWSQIISQVQLQHRDLIFYAGTVTRPKVMHFLAKAGFALSDSYFMWRNRRHELAQYVQEVSKNTENLFSRPVFWTNTHQINPYNLQSGHEPQQLIRFFLTATLSGVYGIYGPVFEHNVFEGFPGKEDYWSSEKFEIKTWNWEKETKLTYLIGLINKIRKENAALQQTNEIHVCDLQQDHIFGYLKSSKGNRILCVVNLDAYQRHSGLIRVPLDKIRRNDDEQYIAHDLVTDARYVWKGEWNYIELDPYIMPFHLLRIENIPSKPGQSVF